LAAIAVKYLVNIALSAPDPFPHARPLESRNPILRSRT
jgi:hypothetical protein